MTTEPGKTADDDAPAWVQALIARIEKLEGKTTDEDPNNKTGDEDAEEDKKVTGDAAFKRNIIADAEILIPGFQPNGDKSLKRQVLNQAVRTGDSLKAFGISDFSKVPKATVDAVFSAAVEMQKTKNHIMPPSVTTRTTDGAVNTKGMSPAQLNQLNATFWKRNK